MVNLQNLAGIGGHALQAVYLMMHQAGHSIAAAQLTETLDHNPMTLLQSLREKLASLDNANVSDLTYRSCFSSRAKEGLRRNETWRGRLIKWINQVEQREREGTGP